MTYTIGIVLVLAFLWGAHTLWKKAWDLSVRTVDHMGGDHFILDRDSPAEKR